MNNPLSEVPRWMKVAKQEPSQELCDLYHGLIIEEFNEYFLAETPAERIDGIVDLIWVCIGKLHAEGLDPQECWNLVSDSNWGKFHNGVCLKRADGKIQKTEGWKAPDWSEIVASV